MSDLFEMTTDTVRIECVIPDGGRRYGMVVGLPNYPVRVTHIPTGVTATARCTSQHMSRNVAFEMVEYALTYSKHLELSQPNNTEGE